MVKLLLEKGANPNAKDRDGDTPLDLAVFNSDEEKIKLLRQYGAKSKYGKSDQQLHKISSSFFQQSRECYMGLKNYLIEKDRLHDPIFNEIRKHAEKKIDWCRDEDVTEGQMAQSDFGKACSNRITR